MTLCTLIGITENVGAESPTNYLQALESLTLHIRTRLPQDLIVADWENGGWLVTPAWDPEWSVPFPREALADGTIFRHFRGRVSLLVVEVAHLWPRELSKAQPYDQTKLEKVYDAAKETGVVVKVVSHKVAAKARWRTSGEKSNERFPESWLATKNGKQVLRKDRDGFALLAWWSENLGRFKQCKKWHPLPTAEEQRRKGLPLNPEQLRRKAWAEIGEDSNRRVNYLRCNDYPSDHPEKRQVDAFINWAAREGRLKYPFQRWANSLKDSRGIEVDRIWRVYAVVFDREQKLRRFNGKFIGVGSTLDILGLNAFRGVAGVARASLVRDVPHYQMSGERLRKELREIRKGTRALIQAMRDWALEHEQ